MSYNKLWDPLNPPSGAPETPFERYAKVFLAIGFVLLCLVETTVIEGLWFKHKVSPDTFERFEIPIFVLFPFLLALAAGTTVRKLSRVGDVKPSVVARIQYVIGIVLFMAYFAMLQLAKIAFR